MEDIYITPIIKIYSNLDEAKKFLNKPDSSSVMDMKKELDMAMLVSSNRNLIIGEPGVGKTLLIKKIQKYFHDNEVEPKSINLRSPEVVRELSSFLESGTKVSVLLLDGLDEVKADLFLSVIEKIESFSLKCPNLQLFVSARSVFIQRHTDSFDGYRVVAILPFNKDQVKEYLKQAGYIESDTNEFIQRMSFGHQLSVLQIPRYLFYARELLKEKGIKSISVISRSELFEHCINAKLNHEEKKLNQNKLVIKKRILEQLALVMEIYQTNVISQDELMTFFGDLKSDLKQMFFSQMELENLYEKSILRVSNESPDKVEFDNTEFQEYLAAKAITRLPYPNYAAFAFAAESQLNELYPSWFNTLTFLIEMQPDLFEQLIEFSEIRAKEYNKGVDENFLNFITRIGPNICSRETKCSLFRGVVEYHERAGKILAISLADSLLNFFDLSLEPFLKEHFEAKDTAQFIPLVNVSYIAGCLFKDPSSPSLDKSYWRSQLLSYVTSEQEELQQGALYALRYLDDPSVIDELPDLTNAKEPISRGFLLLCMELSPDHPKSLAYFFKATRRGNLDGRYGFFEMKKSASIKKFLEEFIHDEGFRNGFMGHALVFHDKDHLLVEKIGGVLDEEIRALSKEILVWAMRSDTILSVRDSSFITGLWQLLKKDDPLFLTDMIKTIHDGENGKGVLWLARKFFVETVEKNEVEPYIKLISSLKLDYLIRDTMLDIKFSGRQDTLEVYEAGRSFLPEEYQKWENEEATRRALSAKQKESQNVRRDFQRLLMPEVGKYDQRVFGFYNKNFNSFNLLKEDRKRLEYLLSDEVFKKFDPVNFSIVIQEQGGGRKLHTMSSPIPVFGDAIVAAKHLDFDVTPYRQKIINFIPFGYNSSEVLPAIFELIKNIQPEEMDNLIKVYQSRDTDSWRVHSYNLVQAVKKYHLVRAVPVLKSLIKELLPENSIEIREAIELVDSIAPDAGFLREIFDRYKNNEQMPDSEIANLVNELLIKTHLDETAVQWRLQKITKGAKPFIQRMGMHELSSLENELWSKRFARSLMQVKDTAFKGMYFELLTSAVNIFKKGENFVAYSKYMCEIVFAYFDNLKEEGSYEPFKELEGFIRKMKSSDAVNNWLMSRVIYLRRSYLAHVGKIKNIAKAVAKYNKVRDYDPQAIRNSSDLFSHLKDVLETDIKRWIEGEGAYRVLLCDKITQTAKQSREELIQKTLKGQIENAMLKRKFSIDILREPQLLDNKRVDFIIRYGFIGPILLEIKLTSNGDMKSNQPDQTSSYSSMERYMKGFGASHGIFMLVCDTDFKEKFPKVREAFQKMQGVEVLAFDCNPGDKK